MRKMYSKKQIEGIASEEAVKVKNQHRVITWEGTYTESDPIPYPTGFTPKEKTAYYLDVYLTSEKDSISSGILLYKGGNMPVVENYNSQIILAELQEEGVFLNSNMTGSVVVTLIEL